MIIAWEAGGGLCNRLIISAYGIALAEAAGQRFVNLHLDKFEDLFPSTKPRFAFGPFRFFFYKAIRALIRRLSRLPIARRFFIFFSFHGENSAHYSPDNPLFLEEVRRRPLSIIVGWPFIEKMVFPKTETIRSTFTPSQEVLDQIKDHLRGVRETADVLVGVHIRHADYEKHLGGRYFYSPQVYRQTMEKIEALFPSQRVAFLICSDAPKSLEAFSPLNVIPGPGTLLGDLYGLAACDYLIGPPSTFCLWAAFYGRKYIYIMSGPEPPDDLSSFTIPDGHFKCIETVMDGPPRPKL